MKKALFRLILVSAAVLFAGSVFILTGCASIDITDLPEIPWEIIIPETPTNTVPGGAVSETNDLPPVAEAPSILSAEGHKATFLFDNTKTRTLNGTSPHITDGQYAALVQRCLDAGANCIYLYSQNEGDGAGAGYSIFYPAGDIGGDLDRAAITRMQRRMEYALGKGMRIVLWLRSDDSRNYNRASEARQMSMQEDVVEAFDRYVSLYVLGLELDEYMKDVNQQKRFIDQLRPITDKPIVVHYTSHKHWQDAVKSGADGFMVQYGDWFLSAEKVGNITADVIKSTEGKLAIIACEYDKNSDSEKARAKGKEAVRRGARGTGCGRGE